MTELSICNNAGDNLKGELKMASGTVKWFNGNKGYGFIAPEGGKKDVFVHITALQAAGLDGLDDGQAVNFEIEVANDGRESATNIQLA
jgi:CspA family cold shock protein